MKLVSILVALSLFLLSCGDEPSPGSPTPEQPTPDPPKLDPPSVVLTGVVIDGPSNEPIENVEIIGFRGGVHYGNLSKCLGAPVVLGTTDKCGRFEITLPDSIKGASAHGQRDTTGVLLRVVRPDYGDKEFYIPFASANETFVMEYSPTLEPFFKSLFLVPTEDGKSMRIGWNVYSLVYSRRCAPDLFCSCRPSGFTYKYSDGNVYITRSDSPGFPRHTIPIETNTLQTVDDGSLPPGNFDYIIHPGATESFHANINRTDSDTLFIVKPPEFPVLNHCD